jgi:integrase
MATIKVRTRRDGTPTFRVVWRDGGSRDGLWESETFATKRDAARFCRDVDLAGQRWPEGWVKGVGYQLDEGAEPAEPEPPAPLFVEFGQQYVRDLTGITPATRHRYDRQVLMLSQQLRAVLRAEPTMTNIGEVHVRRWVNAREAAGARPKTIANYHGLLYMILAAAVRGGLRAGNPCAGTRLPDRYLPDADGDNDVVFLTEAQFALIAEAMHPAYDLETALDRRPGRLPAAAVGRHAGTVEDRMLIEVAVGTGLRWSELTALQVHDLDLDGPLPSLSVWRAWKRNPRGEFAVAGEGAYYLGQPKTKKSRRRITLSPTVVAVLRRATAGKDFHDLVFTAPQGAPLNQATFYEDRWKKAVRLAQPQGLRASPRFHDLRHTHAAWLISAGVPLPVIQQRLGHESITTTVDIYGGLLLQAHDAADAAIDAALGGRSVPAPLRIAPAR